MYLLCILFFTVHHKVHAVILILVPLHQVESVEQRLIAVAMHFVNILLYHDNYELQSELKKVYTFKGRTGVGCCQLNSYLYL